MNVFLRDSYTFSSSTSIIPHQFFFPMLHERDTFVSLFFKEWDLSLRNHLFISFSLYFVNEQINEQPQGQRIFFFIQHISSFISTSMNFVPLLLHFQFMLLINAAVTVIQKERGVEVFECVHHSQVNILGV